MILEERFKKTDYEIKRAVRHLQEERKILKQVQKRL